ncbi:hypothetical protein N9J15_02960 [Porticoccaceae bacterium]|nr:hypothetical protein [Porticoccaceae bacterium]MDA8902685.1 hypothetical protein [Porticoccaceae bacterium]MDA8920208.1 hypothetical protein [Porticoccaceae bacterium]MDB2549328.1 hypothetical protein [Porticoccaceae bacterium]
MAATFLTATFLATAFLAGAFLAGAFLAAAFFAAAFFTGAFFTAALAVGALAATLELVGSVFSMLLVAGLFTGALRDLDNRESRIDIALLCVIN